MPIRFYAGVYTPRWWGRKPCIGFGLLPEETGVEAYRRFASALVDVLRAHSSAVRIFAPRARPRRWWENLLHGPDSDVLNPDGLTPVEALVRAARPGAPRSALEFRPAFGGIAAHVVVGPADRTTWLALVGVTLHEADAILAEIGERAQGGPDWSSRDDAPFETTFQRAWIGPHDTGGWSDGERSVGLSVATGIEPAEVYLPPARECDRFAPWLQGQHARIVADFEELGVHVVVSPGVEVWPG